MIAVPLQCNLSLRIVTEKKRDTLPLKHLSINLFLNRTINDILLRSQLQIVNRLKKRVPKATGKQKCVWLEREGKAPAGGQDPETMESSALFYTTV